MATDNRHVTCITKRGGHYNPHERIQGIGGYGNGRWWHGEDDAIANIESDRVGYYVSVNGKTEWVVVAKHEGRKYLKSVSDGYAPNNLLSLPECPG
jgi:hypothetical protein